MSSPRRQFLRHLALSGVALSALPAQSDALPSRTALPTDDSAWSECSEPDAFTGQPPAATFDTTWADKLTAKYRAVFDVPEIGDGVGVWRAGLWLNHYQEVLKATPADLNSVIVIRHAGIPLLMNHDFWETYGVGKSLPRALQGMQKARKNPVLGTEGDTSRFAALTLPKQMARGVIVLGCNMAFAQMVSLVAKADKLPMPEARTKALAMMIPGVILQPNGIFGVTLAQHHGCAYVMAT